MNERIKDLIERATEHTGFLTAGDTVPPLPVREFNKEKFAELIVKECIYAVECTNDRHRRDYFAAKIREHFGIK